MLRIISIFIVICLLQGCATAVAVADVTGSAVVYTAKTVVRTIDAVTPDIINRR